MFYRGELKGLRKDREVMGILGVSGAERPGALLRAGTAPRPHQGLWALSAEVWKTFEDREHRACSSVFLSSR